MGYLASVHPYGYTDPVYDTGLEWQTVNKKGGGVTLRDGRERIPPKV